jgi:exodeoxyribonuclease III
MPTLVSWNVNGIRSVAGKGLLEWLDRTQPDILCMQETKAHPDQLTPEIREPAGYYSYWASAQKKGYSGVGVYVKKRPLSYSFLGREEFDSEGRVQVLEYREFTLINAYFPNSQEAASARLQYKLAFCGAMLLFCNRLRKQGRHIVLCGDYNIAHKPIDLKNPRANENNAGFLPEERAWMDTFIAAGYTDTFRMFNQNPGNYTWWSYRFQARAKDIGWRIDYIFVNQEFQDRVREARILKDVMGADHCPVQLKIKEQ